MARDSLSTASAIINEAFGQRLHDNLVRTGFLGDMLHPKSCMAMLKGAGQVDVQTGGKPYNQTNHISDPTASWFGLGDPWPTAVADGYSESNLNWCRIAVPCKLDRLYVNELGDPAASIEGVMDPIMEKLDKASKSLVSQIERAIHTYQGAKAIVSLDRSIDDSVTYAGIDQALNLYWQSSVGDAASAPLSVNTHLDPRYLEIYNRTRQPTHIWTSKKQEQAYEGTLTAMKRYTDVNVTPDAKFQAVDYEGIPVVAVPNFPAGEWYFVDISDIKLKFLAQRDIVAREGSRMLGDKMPKVAGDIPVAIIPENAGSDDILFMLVAYLQFVVGDPSYHGRVKNLG